MPTQTRDFQTVPYKRGQIMLTQDERDQALKAYVTCALWSELDEEGTALDENFDESDISFGSMENMKEDLMSFIDTCELVRPGIFQNIKAGQIGHDFWLTRNGHGAGFWDRGLGEIGQWLTNMCKPYGTASLWVGEDERVYYQS